MYGFSFADEARTVLVAWIGGYRLGASRAECPRLIPLRCRSQILRIRNQSRHIGIGWCQERFVAEYMPFRWVCRSFPRLGATGAAATGMVQYRH